MPYRLFLAVPLCFVTACFSGGAVMEGLAARNPDDKGPQIRWDLFAEPLPEVPFPNNVGTRSDPTARTGRRVNISEKAPTAHERKLRKLANELDGFGVYAPIWVQFEERIDIEALHAVQTDGDPSNDAVYLVNVTEGSPTFGQRVPMVLGAGPHDTGLTPFPVGVQKRSNYFPNDPRAGTSNILFETIDEDLNGNGIMDPGEDTDDDGVLDKPNLWGHVLGDDYARLDHLTPSLTAAGFDPILGRQYFDLITWYELETETLIVRPLMPLEEATTYAAILTRQIHGLDSDSPIVSPFEWINHTQQTGDLMPLVDRGILTELGIDLGEVAFAWTYTTQSVTDTVETIRAGLYGVGSMQYLHDQFPPRLSLIGEPEVEEFAINGNVNILSASRLLNALRDEGFLDEVGLDADDAAPLFSSYDEAADYFVFAELESPAFLENELGVFRVDAPSGQAEYTRETIKLVCTVPRAIGGNAPPFPVVFYGHGYTSSRFEFLGFAGSLARFGLATCAIDAYGHGLPNDDFIVNLVGGLLDKPTVQLGKAAKLVLDGRARDLNNDSFIDSGGDFWSANTFHTRDVVRQSMIDHMQTIRVLRNFGVETMPIDINGDGQDDLAGDFNADGVPDFGGEVGYYMFGQSLGGIMSGVTGAAEPMIRAAAPTAGGAGLLDIGIRSEQGGVVQAVFLPLMGPMLIGEPAGTGSSARIEIKYYILDVNTDVELPIARIPDFAQTDAVSQVPLSVGDRVRIVNVTNGEMDEVTIKPAAGGDEIPGRFRMQVAADPFDRARIEFYHAGEEEPFRVITQFEQEVENFQGNRYRREDPLLLLQEGFGFARQSPELRRLASLAQLIMEPADPGSYARYWENPRENRPHGAVGTNLLVVNTVGDMNVPVNTGIAHARVAGLLTPEQDRFILNVGAIEGLEDLKRLSFSDCYYETGRVLFDIDDASRGADPEQGPNPTRVAPRHPECDGSMTQPSFCQSSCAPMDGIRATRATEWGVSGMRIPYLQDTGIHGFNVPDARLAFDYNQFQINQIGWYFKTGGRELRDDGCLASHTDRCDFLE